MASRSEFKDRLLFLCLLLPLILLAEILRFIHGREPEIKLKGYRKLYLRSMDRKQITAMTSTKGSDRVILLVHGYLGSTKSWLLEHQVFFESLPHDIVALDLRNHGESQLSLPISAGYYEKYDVQVALKYCKANWDHVTLVATSMGAYSSLYAINDIDENYKPDRIILESFGTDLKIGVANTFSTYIKLPQIFSKYLVRYMDIRYPEMFKRDLIKELQMLDKPMIIAHGELDKLYPPEKIQPIIENMNKKDISFHTVENTHHSELWKRPTYREKVKQYLIRTE